MKIDNSHTIYDAYMKYRRKTLSGVTGVGIGWILSQNLRKANFFMYKNQVKYQQWRQQQGCWPVDTIFSTMKDIAHNNNLACNYPYKPTPTPNNNYNTYSVLNNKDKIMKLLS